MTSSTKRPSSRDIDHRSTKRRKDVEQPVYSTRNIPWSEQLALPERFHRDGKGVWPALRILQERGIGKKKQYLVEWEPHPETGEIFEPTWLSSQNIGDRLEEDWERGKERIVDESQTQPSSPTNQESTRTKPGQGLTVYTRQSKSRRIIPDSSGEQEGPILHFDPLRTPTLTGSSGSVGSATSPIEITETQQPVPRDSLTVQIPPLPSDGAEFESIRGSQFSSGDFGFASYSPVNTSLQEESPIYPPGSSLTKSHISSPVSAIHSTPAYSTRSRPSPVIRTSFAPSRILQYQSGIEITDSIPNSAQSTAPSAQAIGLSNLGRESSPGSDRSLRSLRSNRSQSSSRFLVGRESTLQATSLAPTAIVASAKKTLGLTTTTTKLPHLITGSGSSTEEHTQISPTTQPWAFQSQLPLDPQRASESLLRSSGSMSGRSTRQSPRLQTVVPLLNGASPRQAAKASNQRARIATKAPEISSPLATTIIAEIPDDDGMTTASALGSPADIRNFSMSFPEPSSSIVTPTTIPPNDMHLEPIVHISPGFAQATNEDISFAPTSMQIQQSIEDEPASSNEDASLESKASSSQESLKSERMMSQTDLTMPTYPILGEDEYIVGLPAEGKVQAIYTQTMKVKRKSILKFLRRRGSVNVAGTSATKTVERNEMLELVQRLHDITTHLDLGLPGIPTQYNIPSQEHAAYADYAGSKFVFLGFLIDNLIRRDCTVTIMANPGATHDLIEEYLFMKHVSVRRDGHASTMSQDSQENQAALKIELLSTKASTPVSLDRKPALVIAFDASFESQNAQLKHMKSQFNGVLPVVHLIVTNSSEHIERCLPVSMPSPNRLKALVRATYQAQEYLGGTPTYIPDASDDIQDGTFRNYGEMNKAIRKSPKRKLAKVAVIVANAALSDDFAKEWTLESLPPLTYDEFEDSTTSSKDSQGTLSTPNKSRNRSQTPVARFGVQSRGRSQTPGSRVGTPNTRKRHLEVENAAGMAKRQRMTPVHEIHPADPESTRNHIEELERMLEVTRSELATEKRARRIAEEAKDLAEKKQEEWRLSLANLQRRYEKRMAKSHKVQKENKAMATAVENGKTRIEKLNLEKIQLTNQMAQLKNDLSVARTHMQEAGGDIAELGNALQQAQNAVTQAAFLEKSLGSTKRDFEFLRSQYQDASSRAVEFAMQVTDLEKKTAELQQQANGEVRKLKESNHTESTKKHLETIKRLELEKRNRDVLLKKQDDEIKLLKRNRGVQTRGSSVQPSSPAPRSRQGSPAHGLHAPPGSRASVLRHER